MPNNKTYQQNFIAGVRHFMAENDLAELKTTAEALGIAYMSLYKIMDGSRNPTVEQCITLCEKAGYSANWLFLSKGEMHLDRQMTLQDIARTLKKISVKSMV